MQKFRIYFAASGIIFLVVLAIAPLKDFLREWKSYQHQYNDLILTLPRRVTPADIGIKQIWIRKLHRVDRCTTCHLGLDQDGLAQAVQPFRRHPQMHHTIDEYGCTMCHEGQGLATTAREAHGDVEFWERPMLPRAFMQASCAKCHKERKVDQAPLVTEGRRLIEEANCAGCHHIDGYAKQWVPELSGIGAKVNRTWLVDWLKKPKGYFGGTRMPNFMLDTTEVNDLADFLMTFRSFARTAQLDSLPRVLTSASESDMNAMIARGETRFREARCISCHPINGRGGYVATDLGKVASKVSEVWLYNYIKDPKRLQPGVGMPRFRFTENDLAAVVAYMEYQFVDFDRQELPPHTPSPGFYEKGLAIVKKYNCTGCHRLGSLPTAETMGPDLSTIGSKKLYEIDFGSTTIPRTLPSYIFTKLTSPRVFLPGMKMPKYEFTEREAQAITVALLGRTSEVLPKEFTVQRKPPSTFAPQGKFGQLANDLACFSCHVMFGKGRLVATDLSEEASRAQRKWIEGYFKVPYSIRPVLTERMPNFSLSDADIRTIVDYMETVCVADSLTRDITVDSTNVAKGRLLYFGTYGCQSCHQINLKGGFVGPALDHVGSRLTAGWIYHWLKNPQKFKPDTVEPNNNPDDGQAEALTAFLMSLK